MPAKGKMANIHNDFLLDLMETHRDRLGLLALALGKQKFAAVRKKLLTRLPTVYKGVGQNERRLDNVFKATVASGKQHGQRLYLFEFKSSYDKSTMLQVLGYVFILLREHTLPVTPIVIYTGKANIKGGVICFKDFLRQQNLSNAVIMEIGDLNFECIVLNLRDIDLATLLELAPTIAPALSIVQNIYDLKEEDVEEFYCLCLQLPHALRMKLLEKTGVYIVKYVRGYDWRRLAAIERRTLAKEDCVMGQIKFSRESAVEDALEQGIEQGIEQGQREAAERMLQRKMPDDDVCAILQLSKEQLAEIKRTLSKHK